MNAQDLLNENTGTSEEYAYVAPKLEDLYVWQNIKEDTGISELSKQDVYNYWTNKIAGTNARYVDLDSDLQLKINNKAIPVLRVLDMLQRHPGELLAKEVTRIKQAAASSAMLSDLL